MISEHSEVRRIGLERRPEAHDCLRCLRTCDGCTRALQRSEFSCAEYGVARVERGTGGVRTYTASPKVEERIGEMSICGVVSEIGRQKTRDSCTSLP
jgi:hypothetical protein